MVETRMASDGGTCREMQFEEVLPFGTGWAVSPDGTLTRHTDAKFGIVPQKPLYPLQIE
jgi:hypothetical protein